MNIEKYILDIKNNLIDKGYSGKKIDYKELQNLHKTYGSQLEEKDFAIYVLELNYNEYHGVKNSTYKTTILKERLNQIVETDTEKIRKELFSKGYAGNLIDYTKLSKLHMLYAANMPEDIFAKEVLQISDYSYRKAKAGKRKVYILRDIKNESVEEFEQIKQLLREDGYIGKLINYEDIQKLHKTYGPHISESRFAQRVLEIGETSYLASKNHENKKVIVLKSFIGKTTLQEIEEIKEKLKKDGYEEKTIDYTNLKYLHQFYGKQMLEREFAQNVLGLTYSNYNNIRNNPKKRAVILKPTKLTQEKISEIKKNMIQDGYVGKIIDYKELQIIHQKYGKELLERDFAQYILELTYGQYVQFKDTDVKKMILKRNYEDEEKDDILHIKNKLEKDGFVDKSIDYKELQKLHKEYGKQMSEREFSLNILEIIQSQYNRVKKGTRNAIILKSYTHQLTQIEIDSIKFELENCGYSGKLINYEEFKEIHQKFGAHIPEYRFAQDILGISVYLLGNMRRLPKARGRILKDCLMPISEEEIETIKEVLEDKGFGGKLINYDELQMLHNTYCPQMREEVFASKILEIPYVSLYRKLKDGYSHTKILCSNMKIELVRDMFFKEKRWYTEEEINQICTKNNISFDNLMRQIASNGTNLYTENYKKALEENGKIWIGNTKLSDEYVEQNLEQMMKRAKIILIHTKHRYNITNNIADEDMIQDALLWVIENCGEAENNFSHMPELIDQKIYNSLRRNIMHHVIAMAKTRVNTISLNQRLTPKKNKDKEKDGDELGNRIKSPYNLESEVIEREERNQKIKKDKVEKTDIAEKCIEEMRKQIDAGFTRAEVLKNMESVFGISKRQLLNIMQQYLITNGTVKFENGHAAWSTDSEQK